MTEQPGTGSEALQARGQSLQAVQARLAGQSNAALATLIGLPPDWVERLDAGERRTIETTPPPSQVAEPAPGGARFWERSPGPAAPSIPSAAGAPALPVEECLVVRLAPGVRLSIDRRRYPELDANSLRDAARALRACLRAARPPEENDDDDDA